MRLRNLVGGIALSLFSLLAAPQAFAQSDPCAGPFTGPNVTISKSGSCNITSPINVSGSVSITVTGGSLTDSATINAGSTVTLNVTGGSITDTAAITGGSTVSITQSGGTVNVSDITSTGGGLGIAISGDSIVGTKLTSGQQVKVVANVGSVKFTGDIVDNLLGFTGNMLISAQTSLATGNITTSAPTNYVGWIDLKAYQGGGAPTTFIIGGTGNANGVNGTITEATTSTFSGAGLYVTNGVPDSVGNIQVAKGASIALSDPNLYTGYLILNANKGTITLPSDAPLTMSGSGSGAAGQIYLMASEVSALSGSTVSANQASSAQGFQHGVWIAADTVSFGGSTGLNLSTSGNQSNVVTLPTGAITVRDDGNLYESFGWTISINFNAVGTLTFNGSGSPLAATANGDNSFITMDAYPIIFNAKSVSLTALGTTNHQITLGVGGATQTHDRGITFNVTGATTIDASVVSGSAGTGGQVTIWDDQVTINGATFTVKANGPTSGKGDGGTLSMLWGSTVLNAATKASFTANAATAGTGNGGSITYWPGSNISFGSAANQFSISAKGGVTGCSTSSTCNGGSVSIAGQDMAFASTQATAMNVAAGPTGDGGTIDVSGGNITFTTGSTYALVANAGTTQGKGGTVRLNAFAALKVGTGAGAVNIAAKGAGTGDGGTIDVTGLPLTLAGANVSVTAGTGAGSNANGGKIFITTNFGGTITGTLNVNGVGTGQGGTITLTGDTPEISGVVYSAKGGAMGAGGSVSVTKTGDASGNANISVPGANLIVTASGNGAGGTINLKSTNGTVTVTGTLSADGSGSGLGGKISLDSGSTTLPLDIDGATISASSAANGSGSGNIINISSAYGVFMGGTKVYANANGSGTSFGGSIHISSPSQIYLTQPNTMISATGATNGAGGNVIFTNTAGFDVNSVINVDAGSGTINDTGIFAGIIQLNGVECRQWHTGYTWPTAYWNCVNPSLPTATDQLPAQVASALPNGISTSTLQPVGTILYVQKDPSQHNAFFVDSQPASQGAFTFAFDNKTRPLYTSIYENTTLPALGYTALSNQWLTETTTHEMGHSIDAFYGVASAQGGYVTALTDDFNYIDSAGGGHPCTAGLGHAQGPFVGVIDIQTRLPFCTSGVFNNPKTAQFPNGIYTDPNTGQLYSNSNIALQSSQNLHFGTFLGLNGFVEPYAQSLAYQAYSNTETYPSGYFDPTADGLMHNGFFQCAQSTAASLLGAVYVPTYACN